MIYSFYKKMSVFFIEIFDWVKQATKNLKEFVILN